MLPLALQGVAEAESRRAADVAEAAYQQAFNQDISADEAALDREFARALSAGQAAFREVAVGRCRWSLPRLVLNTCIRNELCPRGALR